MDSISLRSKFLSRHDMSMTIWRTWCNSIYKNSETFEHKSQITHKTGDTKPHHLFYSMLFMLNWCICHVKLIKQEENKSSAPQVTSSDLSMIWLQWASILSKKLALKSWSLLSSSITLHLQEIVESGSVASDNYTKWESKLGKSVTN